ncbi:MAG: hypothetical protein U0350_11565 [Caldilineaceae bacterium]
MKQNNTVNELTTPVTQDEPAPIAPATKGKRPFVPPTLIKQGKVTDITRDFGGSITP